jgi:hypothetical protein
MTDTQKEQQWKRHFPTKTGCLLNLSIAGFWILRGLN